MYFYQYFDLFTIFCSILLLLLTLKDSKSFIGLIIYGLIYVFYIVPLDLDYLVGMPEYTNPRHYGFRISYDDPISRVLYDCFVLWVQFIVLRYLKKCSVSYTEEQNIGLVRTRFIVLFMLLPPILSLVVLRNPALLYTFQWNELDIFNIHRYFTYVEQLTYVAISFSLVFLFMKQSGAMRYIAPLFAFASIYMNICIQGKRGILFFAIVVFVIIVLYRTLRTTKKILSARMIFFLVIGLAAVVAMVIMSVNVKLERGYAEDLLYDTLRVDFFRDDRVRLAIYSELHPEKIKMLDWYGQTFFYNITHMWPLNLLCIWLFGMVLLNYQQFLSAAVQGTSFTLEGYMTPSIFSETISNLGILVGIFVIPYICIWFIKKAEGKPYPLNVLIITCFVLLNMFSFNYIVLFLQIVIIFSYLQKRKKI